MPTATDTRKQAAKVAADIAANKAKANAPKPDKSTVFDSLNIVPDWDASQELKQLRFGDTVESYLRLKATKEECEAKMKALTVDIQAALTVAGLEKVRYEDRPVQIVNSNTGSKVVPEKLLAKGVSADLIAECTEPGKPYSYVLVGKPSSK